ncbi:aromatic amino acid lyase [Klenkia sp. LSe6-5]|uniref:Aromatic amino acid lyase n=1 Tax=Klenkia sesuvii TaxID=3103137 RepID=A0ABU8DS15_9ACTN
MTVHVRTSADIDLETFRRVAWGREHIALDPELLAQVEAWRQEFLALVQTLEGMPIYGVSVHAGDGSNRVLTEADRASYATGLNSATSFGAALPEEVVRGMVLARLGSFVDGSGGVSAELAQHVADLLARPLPRVPVDGTAGSGEIQPLGHLFASVPGNMALGAGEAMALVNGSPCAGALTAHRAIRMEAVLQAALPVITLAVDALDAPEGHTDPALGQVWANPSEADAVLEMGRALGSDHPRRTHQAKVSVRILPRCIAAANDALDYLTTVADSALRHPGDNPAFIPAKPGEAARVVSNGSFHNQRSVVAIDTAARTVADLVQLGQHLLHAIYLDNEVLPRQDNLALGTSYMPAAAWSEEARALATPSLLSFAAVGQNDVPNPLFAAWRKATEIDRCLLAQVSLLGAMASQAFATNERQPAPALQPTLQFIQDHFAPVTTRRDVGTDFDRLLAALVARVDTDCGTQRASREQGRLVPTPA